MFSPEQLVVYPAQGVGMVEKIETQEISGALTELYIVRIFGSNIKLMVPVKNALHVGLRDLSSREHCQDVLKSLKDRSGFTGYTGQNWNRRYREYSERLKSGTLEDSSHVLKDLLLISADKELSFGERRLLEQAMGLVSTEIACVMDSEQEMIQARIEELFADILQNKENNEEALAK